MTVKGLQEQAAKLVESLKRKLIPFTVCPAAMPNTLRFIRS
jgi:hypothetical protein